MAKFRGVLVGAMFFLCLSVNGVEAQRGKEMAPSPVVFEALDPVLRKYSLPQELYYQYKYKPWEYTNYAREHYRRYTEVKLEGEMWYDVFGNFVTKGFSIYKWYQTQPEPYGSSVFKASQFGGWFDGLVIASDRKGEYHTSVTVGNSIRTTLTPLTFSKPAFNGMQWDFLSDKYGFTALASRVSAPGFVQAYSEVTEGEFLTSLVNLIGGRGTVQVGQFVKSGFTYVNSQIQRTDWSFSGKGMLQGQLSGEQNRDLVKWIRIRISDDSPEDGVAGGKFYSEKVFIKRKGQSKAQEDIRPLIQGGFRQNGALAADGRERIELIYTIPAPEDIEEIEFELVLANDYLVEATSNLQEPAYLPVARARGNVWDNSNQTAIRFTYGLPTAHEVAGVTLEVEDLLGFHLMAEYDVSRRHRKTPNRNFTEHAHTVIESNAWYLNLGWLRYPYSAFGEVFSIEPEYQTRMFTTDAVGAIDYDSPTRHLFEFVDDNDDGDRDPDWTRRYSDMDDDGIFPGWDEDNDGRPDINQNMNRIPDYEEPFLRYRVDPPEFLFGIDMNNNTLIDRFEDDDLPDYPYKRDHYGYNLYGAAEIVPDVKLLVGRTEETLWSNDKESRTNYVLFTLDRMYPRFGRLRIFEQLKFAKDHIPDDVLRWTQTSGSVGQDRAPFPDPMAARDTWINTTFLGADFTRIRNLNIINTLKYEWYDQRNSFPGTAAFSKFLGIINKVDYTFHVGSLEIEPRIKSMYRYKSPFLSGEKTIKEFTEFLFLVVNFPVLSKSRLQLGLEQVLFRDQEDNQNNYNARVLAAQFSNTVDYLGYAITTNIGFEVETRSYEAAWRGTGRFTTAFMNIFAGIGE